MDAKALIEGSVYALGPLQAAEIVASRYGFYDLDLDTDDRGTKIVASGPKRTLTVRGKTISDAVDNLIETLTGE